jgi:hypothetical protein
VVLGSHIRSTYIGKNRLAYKGAKSGRGSTWKQREETSQKAVGLVMNGKTGKEG